MRIKLALSLILFLNAALQSQEFRFAVWGDSQFQNPEVFEETVRRTELLKPAFVIHVGDMIHGYTYNIDNARRQWKRFKTQISPLTAPFYPTPGNHDITVKEIQEAYTEAWGEDKLFYSFDYGNSHFIILNAFLDQKFDSIPLNELHWLKEDLRKNTKENIFVSLHSPLHLNSRYDWKQVHNILKEYPVRGVFTGHYHVYDYRVIDGIKYFCLNSSGNMGIYNELAGRSHHFLYVTVSGTKIDIAVFTRQNIYPPDFVLPEESAYSSPFLEQDKTIVINGSPRGLDTTLTIHLKNKSSRERTYNIQSSGYEYGWNFNPAGYMIRLDSGESDSAVFSVSYSGKDFSRNGLPKVRITSDYYTLKNQKAEHVFYYSLFSPPGIPAKRTGEMITVDGLPGEKDWDSADSITELYTDQNYSPAEERTVVKLLYDNENLYVYVKGDEPSPVGLSSSAYGEIPLVFGDDDFELYFDTDRDLKTFYRLMVNPRGTVLCSGPKGLFSFKFDVKTYVGPDYWSAEFRIPLSELGINEEIYGTSWGFNVRRHRQQAEVPQSDWSKMNTYPPYQPEYFGLLHFR